MFFPDRLSRIPAYVAIIVLSLMCMGRIKDTNGFTRISRISTISATTTSTSATTTMTTNTATITRSLSTVIAPPKRDVKKKPAKEGGNPKDEPAVPDWLFQETRDVQKEFEEYTGNNQYLLILYNDPFNKRRYVQQCLMDVLSFSEQVAEDVMLQAHNYGFAVAGEYAKEIAIDYAKQLTEKGLVVEAKPADDSCGAGGDENQ